ncbi:MAG: hypothetical protein Q4B09_09160 [Lachnospiraceae bacterium]|nr:hypothetical protein [Lachnospiraceae bacterium]
MTANQKRAALTGGIVMACFTLITLIAPLQKGSVYILSFLFTWIAACVAGYGIYRGLLNGTSVKSKYYGFPIARIGGIYFVIQLILSILLMITATFIEMPMWIAAILYIALLAATGIGMIGAVSVREEVERQDSEVKRKTSVIRELQSISAGFAGLTDNPEVKKKLQKLTDELRFSDPVSSEETAGIENKLREKIEEIRTLLTTGEADREAVTVLCEETTRLIGERNRICKDGKR